MNKELETVQRNRNNKNAFHQRQMNVLKLLKIVFVTLLFAFSKVSFSQTNKIDSLKKALNNLHNDQLSILLELCKQSSSMNADTALAFAVSARKISEQRNDFKNRILSGFYIAELYNMKGRADTCLIISEKELKEIPRSDEYFSLYRNLMWNKIVSLTKLRRLKESINECYILLADAERNNDIPGQVIAYNCLGVNNNILENRTEALSQVRHASLLIESDTGSTSALKQFGNLFGVVYINLSAMYFYHNMNDSGFLSLRKAYSIAKSDQNLRIESNYYTLKGEVFLGTNQADSAEIMLQKALSLEEQIGSVQNILVGLDAMETFYAKQKNYTKAINYIRREQWYSQKYNEPLVFQAYRDLASYYKALKNYTAYGETLDTLMMLKDSLWQKSKAEDLAKLEAQYEITSKEAVIAKQKLQLLHKNIWIVSVVMVLLLLLLGSFLIYRSIRRRQKIALDVAEENERKRIAADLHDNIGAYASAIADNIEDIENRKLIADTSSLQTLKNNAGEIVSSLRDTIWAFNKEAVNLTGISDRLKLYLQKIQPSYPGINITLEEKILGEKKLSPVQALHTFRIVQEAINNALRHSGGDKILVYIEGTEAFFDLSVRDNGSGFDPSSKKNAGNGLTNMKSRAAEAGYILEIYENEPKGTVVRLHSSRPAKNNQL